MGDGLAEYGSGIVHLRRMLGRTILQVNRGGLHTAARCFAITIFFSLRIGNLDGRLYAFVALARPTLQPPSLRCETARFQRKLSLIWGTPCNCRNQAITLIEKWYRLEIAGPKSLAGSLPGSVLTNALALTGLATFRVVGNPSLTRLRRVARDPGAT